MTAIASWHDTREKLTGYPPEVIEKVWQTGLFRWIVVEADGAARKPIKVPAAHEPVIPSATGWVVGLVGLSGIGKPFTDEWVFRPKQFQQITGLRQGETVSARSIASILLDARGLIKGAPAGAKKIVFLNQADTAERIGHANQIISLLKANTPRFERVIVGRLEPKAQVIDCTDFNG